ncbi:MAG: lytic transglycosylase [Dethiosulfovibrio peptidovorans]|nr:MAG: lytic transglycosylase [Dethiosulfovibrio peptidovorans]
MERISLLQRRLGGGPPAPIPSASFEAHLQDQSQKTGQIQTVTAQPLLPSEGEALSGIGSVIKSRLGQDIKNIKDLVGVIAQRYGVDEKLVRSVISVESAWRPDALSSKGARGLMQLMPGTARMLGVDPDDPVQNIEGGVKYLSMLSEKYKGNLEKILAAYNAGPSRVDQYDGIPPYRETENYVRKVLRLYQG